MNAADVEARRRIRQAANLIASAIRLGADPQEVARAVASAVEEGAEQYAEDVKDDYRKAGRVSAAHYQDREPKPLCPKCDNELHGYRGPLCRYCTPGEYTV